MIVISTVTDHPLVTADELDGQTEQPKWHPMVDLSTPVSSSIFKDIKEEIKRADITQQIFAGVTIQRTQGLLSEILRKGHEGLKNKTIHKNVLIIQAFLEKPEVERRTIYEEYRHESKDTRRLHREYYEVSQYTLNHQLF